MSNLYALSEAQIHELSSLTALEIVDNVLLPLLRMHGDIAGADAQELVETTIIRGRKLRASMGNTRAQSSSADESMTAPGMPAAMQQQQRQGAPVQQQQQQQQQLQQQQAARVSAPAPLTSTNPRGMMAPGVSVSQSLMYKGRALRDVSGPAPGGALPGYIFHCSKATFNECLARWLLGSPEAHFSKVKRIAPGWTVSG